MWLTLKFDFIEIVAINFHHNTTFKNLVYVANFKFKMKIRVTPTVDSARLVLCAPRSCHITPLLRELHWLPVRSRIEFKLLLITFKVLKGLAPLYLSELISVLPPSSYNLRRNYNGTLLCTPKSKSKRTLGDRAFSSAAPALWNSLPFAIRNVDQSVESFKNKLKTHLFARVFTE